MVIGGDKLETYHCDERRPYCKRNNKTRNSPRPNLDSHSFNQTFSGVHFIVDTHTSTFSRHASDLAIVGSSSGGKFTRGHELFDEGEEDGDDDGCFHRLT